MKKTAYLLLMLVLLVSCAKSKEDQVLRYVQKTIGKKPDNIKAGKGDILYEFAYKTDKQRVDLLTDFRNITNGLDKITNSKHQSQRDVPVRNESGRFLGNSDINSWNTKDMDVLLELFAPETDDLPHKINVRVISNY